MSGTQRVAKLIGDKCLLKCNLSGHAVTGLLHSGAQVSIIDPPMETEILTTTGSGPSH